MPAESVEVFWAKRAKEDYAYWRRRNPRTARRIDDLIEDIKRNPFTGLGKPEPLKHDLTGYWSRRSRRKIGWFIVLRVVWFTLLSAASIMASAEWASAYPVWGKP